MEEFDEEEFLSHFSYEQQEYLRELGSHNPDDEIIEADRRLEAEMKRNRMVTSTSNKTTTF